MLTPSLEHIAPQRGSTMIEVLVTIVIIAFGLLGIAGLQVRLQTSEMESYQRSQALLLLSDMSNRITINRNNANAYLVAATSPLGVGANCGIVGNTTAARDRSEWCEALQGASETSGAGAGRINLGAMIGGRGCVEQVGNDFLLTVAWQGLTPISAPPASVACGKDSYDTANTPCVNDRCRRVVTTVVGIAVL